VGKSELENQPAETVIGSVVADALIGVSGKTMRRRKFTSLLGGTAAILLAAGGQQADMPVIGFLSARSAAFGARMAAAYTKAWAIQDTSRAIICRRGDRIEMLSAAVHDSAFAA